MSQISNIYRFREARFTPAHPVLPIIANLPHSGLAIPEPMRKQLKPEFREFLPNQDWHLQHLYDFLPEIGISTLQATHSRYASDLNRELTDEPYGSFWKSVIPNQTAYKHPLYDENLNDQQIQHQLDTYYSPYHQRLDKLLTSHIAQHGRVLLLDLHSFGAFVDNDVILGNAKGTSCDPAIFSTLSQCFAQQGFDVVENKVFTGGHITRHYSNWGALLKKKRTIQTIQIELRYELYLNEQALKVSAVPGWQNEKFRRVQAKLRTVFTSLCEQMKIVPA